MYPDLRDFSNITFFFRDYSFRSLGWEAKAFESILLALTISWTLTAMGPWMLYAALSLSPFLPPLSHSFFLFLPFFVFAKSHILRNSGCCIATCNALQSAAALGFDRAKNSGRTAGKQIGKHRVQCEGSRSPSGLEMDISGHKRSLLGT